MTKGGSMQNEEGKRQGQVLGQRPRITSGFVFKSVFGDDPEMCRELLEVALDTSIREVSYVSSEAELELFKTTRGGRLDVKVVGADGTNYDVEIQAESRKDEWLRARHYQALVDALQLRKGAKVSELRDNVVLFICDFDPLGDGLKVYDCRTCCMQTGKPIPDGRRIVALNARGTEGKVSERLDAFLRYVAGKDGDAELDDEFVSKINAIINRYITNPEWLEQYMTFEDELEAAEQNAWRRGVEHGLEQGIEQGIEQGRLEAAARLAKDGGFDVAAVAEAAGVSEKDLRAAMDKMA